jgi:hypothetical protein
MAPDQIIFLAALPKPEGKVKVLAHFGSDGV